MSSPESLAGDHANSDIARRAALGSRPSLKPPEGGSRRKHHLLAGQETKTRRKFSQGPGGPGARSSPRPAQWRRDEHGGRAVTPKSSCYPGQDRLAKEGAMTHWATQGPRAPRGLLSHCTREPSFWTPFPWPRTSIHLGPQLHSVK